jgi:hypothetical protein
VTTLHFHPNSLSDPTFEAYLRDTHRLIDYRDVRDVVLPELFESMAHLSMGRVFRFTCSNRFEGQFPALRVQSPVGFVPDLIDIEFPHRHEFFVVKQTGQVLNVHGFENLTTHLRVLLVMGFAHWHPT